MSSILKNLKEEIVVTDKNAKIGIVKSEYNPEITNALLESCVEELKKSGVKAENIQVIEAPGAWELPMACQILSQKDDFNALVAIGHILKGQTPHFDFIASACAQGIMDVSLKQNIPISFGVLTTNDMKQAEARIKGGSHGDKGIEIAQATIKMLTLN